MNYSVVDLLLAISQLLVNDICNCASLQVRLLFLSEPSSALQCSRNEALGFNACDHSESFS